MTTGGFFELMRQDKEKAKRVLKESGLHKFITDQLQDKMQDQTLEDMVNIVNTLISLLDREDEIDLDTPLDEFNPSSLPDIKKLPSTTISGKPDKYIHPTSKTNRLLFGGMNLDKIKELNTNGLNFGDVAIIIKSTNESELYYPTAMDNRIKNAIAHEFYDLGHKVISLNRLWSAIGGNGNPNPNQLESLKKDVLRLLSTPITMEIKFEDVKYRVQGNFINGKLSTTIINGKVVKDCLILDGDKSIENTPIPLYVDDKLKECMMTYNLDYLTVPNEHLTEDNMKIQEQLAYRIEECRLRGHQNIILWSTFWKEIGLDGKESKTRVKRSKLKKSICKYNLPYYVEKEKIEDYVVTQREIIFALPGNKKQLKQVKKKKIEIEEKKAKKSNKTKD